MNVSEIEHISEITFVRISDAFFESKWQNGLASYCIFVTKTPSVKQHSKKIVFKKFNLQHKLPQNK